MICSRTEFTVGLKAAQHHIPVRHWFVHYFPRKKKCSALRDFTLLAVIALYLLLFICFKWKLPISQELAISEYVWINIGFVAHVTNYQFNYLILRILLRQNEFPSSARARPGPILVLREAPGKSGQTCARYVAWNRLPGWFWLSTLKTNSLP